MERLSRVGAAKNAALITGLMYPNLSFSYLSELEVLYKFEFMPNKKDAEFTVYIYEHASKKCSHISRHVIQSNTCYKKCSHYL
jgi:hypothetical protein